MLAAHAHLITGCPRDAVARKDNCVVPHCQFHLVATRIPSGGDKRASTACGRYSDPAAPLANVIKIITIRIIDKHTQQHRRGITVLCAKILRQHIGANTGIRGCLGQHTNTDIGVCLRQDRHTVARRILNAVTDALPVTAQTAVLKISVVKPPVDHKPRMAKQGVVGIGIDVLAHIAPPAIVGLSDPIAQPRLTGQHVRLGIGLDHQLGMIKCRCCQGAIPCQRGHRIKRGHLLTKCVQINAEIPDGAGDIRLRVHDPVRCNRKCHIKFARRIKPCLVGIFQQSLFKGRRGT